MITSKNNFAVFILTHGRPDRVHTVKSLKASGYTGAVFIVVDDEDETVDEYKRVFGEQVIVFGKKESAATFDNGDNFEDRRAIIYARNACFGIAKKLGIKYFLQLDDDYTSFIYKFDHNLEYKESRVLSLDRLFDVMLNFYLKTPALTIAMAQNGDFIGGKNSGFASDVRLHRKAMNTFFCAVARPFQFVGRINEDVNTYTSMAAKGGLFLTIPNVAIIQVQTQKNKGGMTETYLDSGTYVKSFYTVMYAPSCTVIGMIGTSRRRLHHRINWRACAPRILSEKYQKISNE